MNENIGGFRRRTYARQSNDARMIAFIRKYVFKHGYAPTFREIAKAMGGISTSIVKSRMDRLVIDGRVKRITSARAIVVIR